MRAAWLIPALVLSSAPLPAAAAGGISYVAHVESLEVEAGVPFMLTVTITIEGNRTLTDIQLPPVGGLEVLSTQRSEGSQVQLGGGATSIRRTIKVSMQLVADKPGKYTIGKGYLLSGRDRVESEPFTVTVVPSGSSPRRRPQTGGQFPDAQPDAPPPPPPTENFSSSSTQLPATPAMIRSGLFATLEADRTTVKLGEQVTLTVRLFSRVDLSDIETLRLPKLEGFWTEELENPRRITPNPVMVNGQRFQAYLLRRLAVFPTRAGEFELPAVEADVTTGSSFFSAGRRQRAASMPLTLTVEPLPAEGQPADFQAGNVGQFKLVVKADKNRVSLSQPVTVSVRVEGQGNLRQLVVPRLTETPDVRIFDPTPTEQIDVRGNRFTGFKQLDFLVQAKRTGAVELPAVTFSSWDPEAGQYRTEKAEPVLLDVLPDDATARSGTTPRGNILSAQARPLRAEAATSRSLPMLRGHPMLPVLLGGPLLIAIGSLSLGGLWRRRKEQRSVDRSVLAREATAALKDAARNGGGPEAVSAALNGYLTARLGPQVAGMTRDQVHDQLRTRGAQPDDAARLRRLLEALDEARYAPQGAARTMALADEAVAAVRALESTMAGKA
ncbi:MAG: BatD family protein [Myxococcota bacterium]